MCNSFYARSLELSPKVVNHKCKYSASKNLQRLRYSGKKSVCGIFTNTSLAAHLSRCVLLLCQHSTRNCSPHKSLDLPQEHDTDGPIRIYRATGKISNHHYPLWTEILQSSWKEVFPDETRIITHLRKVFCSCFCLTVHTKGCTLNAKQ